MKSYAKGRDRVMMYYSAPHSAYIVQRTNKLPVLAAKQDEAERVYRSTINKIVRGEGK